MDPPTWYQNPNEFSKRDETGLFIWEYILQIMYNNSHATGISVKSTDFSNYILYTYYQIVCSYTKL